VGGGGVPGTGLHKLLLDTLGLISMSMNTSYMRKSETT